MSPEMLLENGYSRMIDFYSLGALLFEMLTGLPPLYDEDRVKIYDKLLTVEPVIPESLSQEARDLISKLLKKNPDERIGSKDGAIEIL
jgi:serine/threonine protein kinase